MEAKKETILIVEDDSGLIDLLNEKIEECGYQTACLQNAADAFSWLKENKPYLIMLDYSLPDKNGKEFITDLKNFEKEVPPFILATGRGDERLAVDMMKLGARDYIIKDHHFLDMIPLVVCRVCSEIDNENKLKEIQLALTESNQFNKQIIESAQEGIIVYDKNLNYVTWNPFMEKVTGIKSDDIIGKNVRDVFPFLTEQGVVDNIELALKGQLCSPIEINIEEFGACKPGWYSEFVSVLRNSEKEIIGVISTVRDISDKKTGEEKLRKSREEFKDLFDNAPIGYHEIDEEGRIILINQTELTMLGYSNEEVIGKYIWDLIPEEFHSKEQTFKKLRGENLSVVPYERNFIKKDGTLVAILLQDKILYHKSGKISGIRSTIQDITNRKKAEEDLKISEDKFRKIFQNTIVGKSLTSIDGKLSVNSAFSNIVGYSEDELSNMHWADFTHKDDMDKNNAETQSILSGEKSSSHWEKRYIHKNGNIIWVDISTTLIRSENQEPLYFITEIYDISDRKKAEEDLQLMKQSYLDIFNSVSEAIYVLDDKNKFIEVNIGAEKMYGYSHDELVGQTPLTVAAPGENDMEDILLQINRVKETGNPETFEFWAVRKNGEIFPKEVSINKGKYFEKDVLIATARDITERKKAEELLRKSEELYRNLVQRIPDGVYKSTPEGKFIDVNPAMVNILGYSSKEELLKIDIKSELYFDSSDRDSAALDLNYEEMAVFRLKKKDGTGVWVEDHGWYNSDKDGKIISHEGVLRDITDRKLAQDNLQKNAEMLNKLLFVNTEFIDSKSDGIDYAKMTDTIMEISGAKYASFNINEENGTEFTTVAVSGLNGIKAKIKNLLGFDIVNKKWKRDKYKEEKIINNIITRFKDIHELADKVLTKPITSIIDKSFNIGELYIVSILKNEKFIGDFTLLFSKGNTIQNIEIVELFVYQAGLYLDRENSDKALRLSEEKYRYLFANNPQPMWIYDINTLEFLEVNQSAINHYGYSREEFLSMNISQIRPLDELPLLLEDIKKTGLKLTSNGTWRHVKKNKEIIDVEITSVRVQLNGREARHVMVQDITERKRAQQSLEESEKMLNKLLYTTTEFIDSRENILDYEKITDTMLEISGAKFGTFNLLNDEKTEFNTLAISGNSNLQSKIKSVFGFDLMDKKWKVDLLKLEKVQKNTINKFNSIYELGENILPKVLSDLVEITFGVKEGFVIKITKNNDFIGDFTLIFKAGETLKNPEIVELFARQIGLLIDREQTSIELKLSEEKFRSITEQTSDLIAITDNKGIITYASPASFQLFQYKPEEMCGHSFTDFLHEESVEIATSIFSTSITGNKNVNLLELKMKRKDGSLFYGELNGTNFHDGNTNGSLVSIHDITERKKSEEALRVSEDKYRTMIENSNDIIWTLDNEGNFMFVNEVGKKITGVDFNEWKGKSFVPLVFEEDLPMLNEVFSKTMKGENCSYELRFKKPDNSILLMQVNTSPILTSDEIIGVVSFGRDITDRKIAEESLKEKMDELMRFQNLTVGRELNMIELKKEINQLLTENGKNEKYKIIE